MRLQNFYTLTGPTICQAFIVCGKLYKCVFYISPFNILLFSQYFSFAIFSILYYVIPITYIKAPNDYSVVYLITQQTMSDLERNMEE